jgi:hypothetical protein
MALRAYTPEQREIKIKGQVLGEVQGLSLENISVLVHKHLPDLEALYALFDEDVRAAMQTGDMVNVLAPVVTQAPGFVANVIALAANEPDGAPTIQQTWPFSAQLAALVVIFELTFSEIGEVKKVKEFVAALLTKAKTKTTGTGKKAR